MRNRAGRRRRWGIALVLAGVLMTAAACSPPPPEAEEEEEEPRETLSFVIDTEQARELEMRAIAQQLRRYGIDVEVRVWEWSALRPEVQAGNRSAYATDWGSAFFDAFDLAVPKLRTEDRGNYSFYSNPEFDRLVDVGISSPAESDRRDAYYRAQEVLQADAPWIFAYIHQSVEAAGSSVGNWQPSMDSRINLHDVTLDGGDTLVVGLRRDAIFALDPAASYRDRETETVIRNMFDGLVTRTTGSDVVPQLAEGWDVSADGLTHTFHLRRGVTFHDGSPFTADDVVFTFEKILGLGRFAQHADTQDGTSRAGLIRPAGVDLAVEKVDDYTVEFTFSQTFPVFLQGLVHQQIVPRAYYQRLIDEAPGADFGAKVTAAEERFGRQPVGAGPFMFVSGQLNAEIRMKRFPDYYGGSSDIPPVGPAQVENVVFRMMPDASTRVAALERGEVHIIQAAPVDMIDRLQGNPNVQVNMAEGTRAYMIEFNNAKAPFDDVRVRLALNYAIDWDPILTNLYRGLAERLPTAFLPSGFGYNPNVRPYAHDPQKAVELLLEAGFNARLPD